MSKYSANIDIVIYFEKLINELEKLRIDKAASYPDGEMYMGILFGYDDVVEFLKIKQSILRYGKDCIRSPIGHKHEIIRMLRQDTECPYSACRDAYYKALNHLRDLGGISG